MLVFGNEDGWKRLEMLADGLKEAAEKHDVEHVLWLLHIAKNIIEQMTDFDEKGCVDDVEAQDCSFEEGH